MHADKVPPGQPLGDGGVGGAGGGGVGGTGGVGVGGVGGVGVDPPHQRALCPPLQLVRHVSDDMQPGFVLHRPQLQLASQLYPQPLHVPAGGAGGVGGAGGDGGAGGVGGAGGAVVVPISPILISEKVA